MNFKIYIYNIYIYIYKPKVSFSVSWKRRFQTSSWRPTGGDCPKNGTLNEGGNSREIFTVHLFGNFRPRRHRGPANADNDIFFRRFCLLKRFFAMIENRGKKQGFATRSGAEKNAKAQSSNPTKRKNAKTGDLNTQKIKNENWKLTMLPYVLKPPIFFSRFQGRRSWRNWAPAGAVWLQEVPALSWSSLTAGSSGLKLEQFDCRKFRP